MSPVQQKLQFWTWGALNIIKLIGSCTEFALKVLFWLKNDKNYHTQRMILNQIEQKPHNFFTQFIKIDHSATRQARKCCHVCKFCDLCSFWLLLWPRSQGTLQGGSYFFCPCNLAWDMPANPTGVIHKLHKYFGHFPLGKLCFLKKYLMKCTMDFNMLFLPCANWS